MQVSVQLGLAVQTFRFYLEKVLSNWNSLKRNLVRWYVFLIRAVFSWRFCLVLDRFRDRDVFEVTQRHLFQRMSSAIVLFKVTVSELCVTVPILISKTVAVLIRSLIVKFVNLIFMFDRFLLVEIGKTRG